MFGQSADMEEVLKCRQSEFLGPINVWNVSGIIFMTQLLPFFSNIFYEGYESADDDYQNSNSFYSKLKNVEHTES